MKNSKNIYLMYAIALLHGMVFYGPIATLYRQAHGLSIFQITLIESISYFLCILLEIPWGIVADKIGYKNTMGGCCTIYFVAKLVFWRAQGFSGFLLERILLSVVIAGISGVDTSILYLSCNGGESQRVFGIFNSMGMAGLLCASLVFSLFIGSDYSAAAFLTVISYGLAAVLSLFLDEVKGEEKRGFPPSELKAVFTRILGNRQLILFLVSVAFMTQAHQTITVFLNQIQYAKCGLSSSAMGYIYIVVTLTGLLGVYSYRLPRALGAKRAGTALYLAAIASCLVLCFTSRASLSVLGILALRITDSLFQPFQLELQNKQVFSENRATELSVYAMIIDGVSAGTSVLFGALANVALESAFLFGAGICLLGLIFFGVWNRHTAICT